MKILNIFPIANQQHYKDEKYVMILAHLLDKYNPTYFNDPNKFVILDNGLYENAQVSTKLSDLVEMAEKCPIKINEIVIPDKFFDAKATIKLFEENLDTIKKWGHKYSFMFVAQSNDINEFYQVIKYISNYKDLNLTIGIPKKAPFVREGDEACWVYKKCPFPIHFLGLTDNTPLKNLLKVKDLIRSCDTSQLATIVKNKIPSSQVLDFSRTANTIPIDLKNDMLNEYKLTRLVNSFNSKYLKKYDAEYK